VRSRAAGLLLLVLAAHAFVASATHFHGTTVPGAQSAHAALIGRDSGGQSAPLAGDDAQCLLCRLQRNLISEVLNATLTVAPLPAEPPSYAALREVAALASRAQLPPGRGPPSI
jgi:hypothetical protein